MQHAHELENALRKRLLDLLENRREFLIHQAVLDSLGVRLNKEALYLSRTLDEATAEYMESICRYATAQHANGTPAKVTLEREAFLVFERRRDHPLEDELDRLSQDNNNDAVMVDRYLSFLDFKCIAQEINRQADELVASGMKLLAATVINQLNLNSKGYYGPTLKNRRITAITYPVEYFGNYGRIEQLTQLQRSLSFVERDAGLDFGQALSHYLDDINRMSYSYQQIPSRTVFGKGAHLEIHCFKDKHEFRFSLPAFNAILAFLTLHGHEETAADLTAALYATAEAA